MSNLHDGYQAVLDAMARGLEPDPNLTVDVWSDEYMQIPKSTGSNEAGKYRTSRTPHAREVMRWLSDDHPCKRVALMVPRRKWLSLRSGRRYRAAGDKLESFGLVFPRPGRRRVKLLAGTRKSGVHIDPILKPAALAGKYCAHFMARRFPCADKP